jgi:2-iminobutanoate/2-iminopropanoate deaminase
VSERAQPVMPENGPKPVGPYSPGLVSGDLVFVSGQVGRESSTGQMAGHTIEVQARQALENVGVVLRAAGCDYEDVVKSTAFLASGGYFHRFNEIYSEFFSEPYPARSTVVCGFVTKEVLVEVEVIARRPS